MNAVVKNIEKGGLPVDSGGNVVSGVYSGLENSEYHASPAISSSQIKYLMDNSPRHYQAFYITKEITKKETSALKLGRLVHTLTLEPDLFDSCYKLSTTVKDYPDALVTNDEIKQELKKLNLPISGKKETLINRLLEVSPKAVIWDHIKQQLEEDPRESVSIELWDQANRIRDSILSHPGAKIIFEKGQAELSVYSTHNRTSLPVKCRPDWYRKDLGIIADLKTCKSAKPEAFAKDVAKFFYHIQQAMYLDCCYNSGLMVDKFCFIAVETEAPYITEVYELDEISSEKGEELYQQGMYLLDNCISQDYWPGYTDSLVSELTLPFYALR